MNYMDFINTMEHLYKICSMCYAYKNKYNTRR